MKGKQIKLGTESRLTASDTSGTREESLSIPENFL